MNEEKKHTISSEDEKFLMDLAADEAQVGDIPEQDDVEDVGEEVVPEDEIEKCRSLIEELEEKLRAAEKDRAAKEKELLCISLLGEAGLPAELSDAVLLSADMEKTVGLIADTVRILVEAEVSKRCRTVAPHSGTRAPMTKEEIARMPVAELQRLRDGGFMMP